MCLDIIQCRDVLLNFRCMTFHFLCNQNQCNLKQILARTLKYKIDSGIQQQVSSIRSFKMSHRAVNSFSIVLICIVFIVLGGTLGQAKRNLGDGKGVDSTSPEKPQDDRPAIGDKNGASTAGASKATPHLADQIIEYDYIVEYYYTDDVNHPKLNEYETEF